ncbi:MAG TPA: metal ABC transporter permease [Solirubrobacteraceae bacterium]|nr:metal ABC transporter permease [Solirubrobacteraceae bacterium]
MSPHLGPNVAQDVSELVEYHFMVNALLAGAIVAVTAGVAGWLMVLRAEAFAGHTLSVMAFPGASAAALAGIPAAWGYYAACALAALAIGRTGSLRGGRTPAPRGEAAAGIALVQAAALAAGFLFLSLYGGVLGDLESDLFGTFLGVSDERLITLLVVGAAVLAVLAAIARPLVFASVDPDVAAAHGVRVRALGSVFLVALGLAVAAASQVTGALLVFSLLVGPAASAQALTSRPLASLVLTVALGLIVAWVGLGVSYFSTYPAGFFIATASCLVYVLARLLAGLRSRRGGPRARLPAAEPAPGEVLA